MQTKDFFETLSYRLKKENDLSDITLAMCLSCNSFRDEFLHFFFPEMEIDENIIIEREVSEEDSRPDFVIINKGIDYLIENKINDKNHHFGQYDKTFNVEPERFGYITNYEINDETIRKKGYRLHTWEQLFNHFSSVTFTDEENALLEGYLEYIKNVCSIIKFTKAMNLDGIYSLYELIKILEKETERETNMFTLSKYNTNTDWNKERDDGAKFGATGVNFQLKYKKNIQKDIWGWIGIFYNRERPLICMGFLDETGWGKPFIDLLRNYINRMTDHERFKKPYFEDDECLLFEMSEDLRNKFNESNDIVKQEKMLQDFMNDVLLCPFQFIKQNKK